MKASQPERVEVFISYAHKDNEDSDPNNRWLDRLREQLAPLVLQNVVDVWSDQDIDIGEDWHNKIQRRLASAKVAVLLVSSAFLASKYIRNSELPVLLQKAKEQGLVILPIILNPCLFRETTFRYPDPANGPEQLSLASLQASGSPNEPLSKLNRHDQDEKLLVVARRILRLVQANSSETPFPAGNSESSISNMSHVFISYVRENSALVNKLADTLKAHGVEVWLDRDNIKPGYRWKAVIRKAIAEGAFFMACFSKEYETRTKTFVNEELTLAIEELRLRSTDKAWFIPVLLSPCNIPDRDIGGGETLRDIYWVKLYDDWNEGIQRRFCCVNF